ncbi:MAG TPA: dihydrofolate reductase family protein [Patescibacteria group bacterium]|nr:dihydrofolate reductase family protein [Patescibacteria group bacterium]
MKVIMYPAITLDGYIADLDGECYSWISEEDEEYYNQAIEKAGCSIVGRKTYEQYIDDFPSKNGSTTFVYTTKSNHVDQDRLKFVSGKPEEVLKKIEGYGFNQVIISGGGEVNGTFAVAGLVNEIIVSIYGVVLGEGISLFGSHKPKLELKLLSSKQEVPGIVKNHYQVT